MLSEKRVRSILKNELWVLECLKNSFADNTKVKVYEKIMILMDVLEIPYDEREEIIEKRTLSDL